jgi:NAD(P)-dependent dehydrogenase (short-subunit alcohol dehydrogenase family)
MTRPDFGLSGRIALVTGASHGLGRAMALAFAAAGADVVVASRYEDACQVVADEIAATTGRRGLAVACHVGRWAEIERLASIAYREFGRVDVLVNNAGMSPRYERLVDVMEALYDKVMGVNLKGPFRLTALVGDRMRADGGGSVINISSVAAHTPSAGQPALRGRESRPERDYRWVRPRLRSGGARQRHHGRAVPNTGHRGMGSGVRRAGQDQPGA